MLKILYYSLDMIDNIYHYYNSFDEAVQSRVAEEKRRTFIGYSIKKYFRSRSSENETQRTEEDYLKLEKIVQKIIDITGVSTDENGRERGFFYSYKNKKKLLEDGCELDINQAYRDYMRALEMPKYYSQTALVNLVTRFEEFIAHFAEYLFQAFPDAHINEKSITFKEIAGKNSEEIRERIIKNEVDLLMRQNQDEWFKLFKSHSINLEKCCKEKAELNEILARRHMIIHNAARVNNSYIKMVKGTSYKEGDFLRIDDEYIVHSIDCIKTIMYIIMIEAVKCEKQKAEKLIDDLFDSAFKELMNKRYIIAKSVFSALKDSKYADTDTKLMSRINQWIAEIELNNYEIVKDQIEKFNTDGLSEEYVLAKLILLHRYEEANVVLQYLVDNQRITVQAIKEWPLFIHYRETNEYNAFVISNLDKFNKEEFAYDSQMDKEREDAIENLVCSSSFYTTHEAINQLSKFDGFNEEQCERLIKAALDNSQIRWIINDEDIRNFYIRILNGHVSETAEELRLLIKN